jgi:hypothetical protein
MISRLVFFLEERSAKEMLQGLLPKLVPDHVTPQYVVFEGKQDLDKQIARRLRLWKTPDTCFLILRDQDSGDCKRIKQDLIDTCKAVHEPDVVVRIACHELESFYLGDLKAVDRGLDLSYLSKLQNKKKYRCPDKLANPSQELYRLTNYHYQKIAGSRSIGKHMDPASNASHSFNVLVKAIKRVASAVDGKGNDTDGACTE